MNNPNNPQELAELIDSLMSEGSGHINVIVNDASTPSPNRRRFARRSKDERQTSEKRPDLSSRSPPFSSSRPATSRSKRRVERRALSPVRNKPSNRRQNARLADANERR